MTSDFVELYIPLKENKPNYSFREGKKNLKIMQRFHYKFNNLAISRKTIENKVWFSNQVLNV